MYHWRRWSDSDRNWRVVDGSICRLWQFFHRGKQRRFSDVARHGYTLLASSHHRCRSQILRSASAIDRHPSYGKLSRRWQLRQTGYSRSSAATPRRSENHWNTSTHLSQVPSGPSTYSDSVSCVILSWSACSNASCLFGEGRSPSGWSNSDEDGSSTAPCSSNREGSLSATDAASSAGSPLMACPFAAWAGSA